MSFESEMTGGYPTEAEIDDFLSDRGIEIPTLGNPNYYTEIKQQVWGLLNALDWATGLGVYCPTVTTFNVRGGKYLHKGTVKTYTPGRAINPTDNDTTYIWMSSDNTISSAIDGTGWPATEHIKLAEIDVDEEGIITAIRDLRGQTFLQMTGDFVLTATLTAGNTVIIHNADSPFKYRVIDAWSIAKSADAGTWKVTDGTNDITNAVAVTATDKTINRAGTIDDAYHTIAEGGSLSVIGDGSLADVEVYIKCIRV